MKSLIRQNAEMILNKHNIRYGAAWVDKSKSGQRVKFGFVHPTQGLIMELRRDFAKCYPNYTDTRVWYVPPTHLYGIGGLAFKVFND